MQLEFAPTHCADPMRGSNSPVVPLALAWDHRAQVPMFTFRSVLITVAIAFPLGACHSVPAQTTAHASSSRPAVVAPHVAVTPALPPTPARADEFFSVSQVLPLDEVVVTGHEPCGDQAYPFDPPARRLWLVGKLPPCPQPIPGPLSRLSGPIVGGI